jgi:23S rRNA pseudouridine2605 synthase
VIQAAQTDEEVPGAAHAERLQKVLARAGVGSRRRCEQLIAEGHVNIDGVCVTQPGTKVDPARQQVVVDGEVIQLARPLYFALHKPPGYVCSSRAQDARPLAVSLVKLDDARLFCVGRLDESSEGLILVTNDGELANHVSHPRYGVMKTYRVTIRGEADAAAMEKLQRGVWLAEGKTAPARVQVIHKSRVATTMLVTLKEGKNRHLRRTFARLGMPVQGILRVRIGGVQLGRLKRGQYRRLTSVEVAGLLGRGPGPAEFPRMRPGARGRRRPMKKASRGTPRSG